MMNEFYEKRRSGARIFLRDLPLLASLCVAEFIVWRYLRGRRKERAARLKLIKLVA